LKATSPIAALEVRLVVRSSSDPVAREYTFPIRGRVVLGRTPDSPVPLEGAAISREHLALELTGDSVFAIDLSNNGTWVNGSRLQRDERIRIENGDAVDLPDHQMTFHIVSTQQHQSNEKSPSAVQIVVPSNATPPPVSTSSGPQPSKQATGPESLQGRESKTTFTGVEIWILLLAVLAVALIVYYFLLLA